jgi:hypothetical protein
MCESPPAVINTIDIFGQAGRFRLNDSLICWQWQIAFKTLGAFGHRCDRREYEDPKVPRRKTYPRCCQRNRLILAFLCSWYI